MSLTIPSTGARWKIEHYNLDQGPQCTVTQNYFLTTAGDTTIAGWPCVRLQRGQAQYCDWSGPAPCFLPFQPAIAGYLHLDAAGRLYGVEPSGLRYAIMDFSLGVGDTMHTTHPQRGTIDYLVDSVDVVTFSDGIPRQRQYLTSAQFPFSIPKAIWVEGIGDLYHGPLPIAETDHRQINLCYTEKATFWQSELASVCPADCDILSGTVLAAADQWSVAPNPSTGAWRLGRPGSQMQDALLVEVIDMSGRVLLRQSFEGNEAMELALPSAKPGMYIANISNTAGDRWRAKLLKR